VAGSAALLLVAAEAAAAVRCVNPANAACFPTIQGGVFAAGPGDVVAVAAGTYFENVSTFGVQEGLQIVGAGKAATIIDPSPYADLGFAGNGPGIRVAARNMSVKNLTIRNGLTIGIEIAAPDVLVQGVNVTGPDQSGISITAQGVNARVIGSEIHNTGIGVLVAAFGALIQANLITGSRNGLAILADGAQATKNNIYNGEIGVLAGFLVAADGVVLKANDIRHQTDFGIFVVGSFPTVQGNKIFGAGTGISVNCLQCFGGSIASNTVTDAVEEGILAQADDFGLVVQGNTVLRAGIGLSLNGERITARLNKATDIGLDLFGHCFEVFGAEHTVAQNTATRCSQAGVYVNGDRAYVDRNVVSGTFENGITVDGDSGGPPFVLTTATGNRAMGNTGQGIAIIGGASSTRVTGNTASGNRHDFCDDGSLTFLANNSFGTMHPDCLIAH
jgi:parallel beta-helix repeat protein